jgi:hypothetical protein
MTSGRQQVSKASFYRIIWHTITTINNCASLAIKLPMAIDELTAVADGFKSKSTGEGAMTGCVRSLDVFFCKLRLRPMQSVEMFRHIIPVIIVAMVSMCKQCVTVNAVCYFIHLLRLVRIMMQEQSRKQVF